MDALSEYDVMYVLNTVQVVVSHLTRKVQAVYSRYKQLSDSVATIFNGTYN